MSNTSGPTVPFFTVKSQLSLPIVNRAFSSGGALWSSILLTLAMTNCLFWRIHENK
jgi:hypothetical protein